MSIEIQQYTLGLAATNSYLVGDTESRLAVLIDPVDEAQTLYSAAQYAGWTIQLILATHAHFDHILASKDLKDLTGAPFWCHAECEPWLKSLPNQARMFGFSSLPEAAIPDRLLTNETETFSVGAIQLQTLYTPGHAPGHLCFFMPKERILFSGDTIFQGSIGRTDLPGADHEVLMHSIREVIFPLGDDVDLLPGHMGRTAIGAERISNPFLQF